MKNTKARVSPKKKRVRSGNGLLSDLVKTDEGVVSSQIFTDPEINRLEMERIFTRTWLYVAHESEIPHAGDFVTRSMGDDPVVVWRGQDGKVRVFLNVCRHRGRRVCVEDMGKASHFKCPYHGWTYSNGGELISVPFYEGYQGKLDKGELGLYQAPRIEKYHGLIFANWETKAEPLADYLGEAKWVLDLLFARTEGLEWRVRNRGHARYGRPGGRDLRRGRPGLSDRRAVRARVSPGYRFQPPLRLHGNDSE